MTIWVFGDSFTKCYKSKKFSYLEDSWLIRTSRILNQELKSFGKGWLTLEHTYNNFNLNRTSFCENDTIIISLTNLDRRWFFRDNPLKTMFLNEEEKNIINHYYNDLELENNQKVYLTNFLHNINNIPSKINLKIIVLPSFHDAFLLVDQISNEFKRLTFADTYLSYISDNEYKQGYNYLDLLDDYRLNHISRKNHIILSDKIIDNILNNTQITFKKDFEKNFLDPYIVDNENFIHDQLFDGIMKRVQNIKVRI